MGGATSSTSLLDVPHPICRRVSMAVGSRRALAGGGTAGCPDSARSKTDVTRHQTHLSLTNCVQRDARHRPTAAAAVAAAAAASIHSSLNARASPPHRVPAIASQLSLARLYDSDFTDVNCFPSTAQHFASNVQF